MEVALIAIIILLVIEIVYMNFNNKKIKELGSSEIIDMVLTDVYNERVSWFKSLNKFVEKDGTVFVGDSITNEYLLAEMLPGKNVYNRGIGGDTSNGVLRRMEESIYAINPSRLYLLIGTNDLALSDNSNEVIVNNISEICILSREFRNDMEINIVSILPVCELVAPHIDPSSVGPRTNERIEKINEMLKEVAIQHEYNYVDLAVFLKDDTGNLALEYTREGLHLSHLAYEVITNKLLKIL